MSPAQSHEPDGRLLHERYRLERVLGQGGTSRTWLAVDVERELELLAAPEPPEDLDEDGIPDAARVAIKELPLSRLREWKDLDLFEREAEMLGGLDHPGIPSSIAHFLIEGEQGPTFYLVQQWIDGENLAERLKQGERFTESQIRDLLAQLLPILHYLHTRTPPLIHRDIKPSNIIIRRDGRVALIDFGAVRTDLDESGTTVAGTFGYMAPEQLQGRASATSDIYALGATLCHLLCRRKPGDMPAREEAFGIDFRPWCSLSAPFADLLDDMLAPNQARRLQNAPEVMARLDTLEADPPPEAMPEAVDEAALTTSGPRGLTGADLGYAYLSLPSKARTFAPLFALFVFFIPPLALIVFLIGLYFSTRSLREGYHNAQIMRRGTIVPGKVVRIDYRGGRAEVEYVYHWGRRAYQAIIEVPRRMGEKLAPGETISVSIDPYTPGDSVPLLAQAARLPPPPS